MRKLKKEVNPARVLILGYLTLILIGATLLLLPISSKGISPIDSLFTATSAVCVTGLIVKNTAEDFTPFGKIVILILIQIGGLGYMTLSTAFFFFLGRGISLQERLLMRESISFLSYENLRRFAYNVVRIMVVVEGFGALLLFLYFWLKNGQPPINALANGIFHSVSAFCNAGFSIFPDNLTGFSRDFFVPLVISFLLISGGIGFVVVSDIFKTYISKKNLRLSLHSKLVILITLILIITGTLLILVLEWDRSLKSYSVGERVMIAYFQAVTPRTAGFNTINLTAFSVSVQLIIVLLMFIGASPGGTGGGIKTTTFGLIVLEIKNLLTKKGQILIFNRRITIEPIFRAFLLFFLGFFWLLTATILLLVFEKNNGGLMKTLFELTSAFGTVGLSLGSSTRPDVSAAFDFSLIGKLLVMMTMVVGRIGTLTVGSALIKQEESRYTYPEGTVLVG